jgi:pimeloyl-ACP methyl ester carboxylesterase
MTGRSAAFTVYLLLLSTSLPVSAQTPRSIAAEDIIVPSGDPGIDIYVRNKHPANMTIFASNRTLLYVHGATYPSSTMFDLELSGTSFMDQLAEDGFDVYAMDLPGYGKSSRPSQMSQPPEANPPLETTADAVRHYGAVVDYVLKRRGVQKLDAMAWSWGTIIIASFTTEQPDKVERLILYAPLWIYQGAPLNTVNLGAYRSVTIDQARQRWLLGVPEDKKNTLIPAGWFDAWQNATWATDPTGNAQNPRVLRAPNGVAFDLRTYYRENGKATYDPARITVPTLLVRGEWDRDAPAYMSQTLFPLIVNAPWKRYVEIGEGTHAIMMEKNRDQLLHVVAGFLTQPDPPKP